MFAVFMPDFTLIMLGVIWYTTENSTRCILIMMTSERGQMQFKRHNGKIQVDWMRRGQKSIYLLCFSDEHHGTDPENVISHPLKIPHAESVVYIAVIFLFCKFIVILIFWTTDIVQNMKITQEKYVSDHEVMYSYLNCILVAASTVCLIQ